MDDERLGTVVAAAVTAALDARTRVPESVHHEHHEWVAAQIARQRARTEFWQALAAKSLPAIAWSLIAAGITGLWHLVLWAKTHLSWS
jgi:hypothetical protein